jgi:lysophospholipase L1-like esterase
VAFGLDAVAAQNQPTQAADMALDASEAAGFNRVAVEYLTQPDGSPLTVQIDDNAPLRVSTAAAQAAIKTFDLPLDRTARHVELRADGRPPVTLLGWTAERRVPGIIYENHGTIGATVDILTQMTPEAVAYELAERRPALLIVAFGTNEGFADTIDFDRYAQRYRAALAELRRRAPQAPILVIGTPDANRAARDCQPAPARCGTSADACTWVEPRKLAGVREVQRHIADEAGWAYWDWFRAMGGTCSIDRMALLDPPLAAADHVHLTRAGYEGIADTIFGDLMNAYSEWKARQPTS